MMALDASKSRSPVRQLPLMTNPARARARFPLGAGSGEQGAQKLPLLAPTNRVPTTWVVGEAGEGARRVIDSWTHSMAPIWQWTGRGAVLPSGQSILSGSGDPGHCIR
jgi:hypothetical protein